MILESLFGVHEHHPTGFDQFLSDPENMKLIGKGVPNWKAVLKGSDKRKLAS